MKKCMLILLISIVTLGVKAQIFVDSSATGLANGTSWVDAFPNLEDALLIAAEGDEVWIAKGTYKPTSGIDRSISFNIPFGVKIYGNFNGTESLLSQRGNIKPDSLGSNRVNETILSGNIGDLNDNTDNSYHVINAWDANSNVYFLIDGVSIVDGWADGSFSNEMGGGIILLDTLISQGYYYNIEIQNTIIKNNYAKLKGGGLCIYISSNTTGNIENSITLINNVIYQNRVNNSNSNGEGGGTHINVSGSLDFNLNSCYFVKNESETFGGGIYVMVEDTLRMRLERSSFFQNGTDTLFDTEPIRGGGALYCHAKDPIIRVYESNVIENYSMLGAGFFAKGGACDSAIIFINHSNIIKNKGDGIYFLTSIGFKANLPNIPPITMIINNSNISGNNGYGIYKNDFCQIRVYSSTIANNVRDGIMMHNYTSGPSGQGAFHDARTYIFNSIIYGNYSSIAYSPTFLSFPSFASVINFLENSIIHNYTDIYNDASSNVYDEDPLFKDANNYDYTLNLVSPALNKGDSLWLLEDFNDINNDGNTLEKTPLDLLSNERVTGQNIDIGAYELQCGYNQTVSLTGCSYYEAPSGQIFDSSGTYIDTLIIGDNCFATTLVDLISVSTTNVSETVCSIYTAPSGALYDLSGIYMDTIINSNGCDSVISINLTILNNDNKFIESKKLVASDRANNDQFGSSVSISENYAVVGSKSNSVYIYHSNISNDWLETQELVASGGGLNDKFGISVSNNDNYIVIGATYNETDISGNNPIYRAGSAYIFERDINNNWIQVQKIVASDRANQDEFGGSVSIYGNYIVVGARGEDQDENGLNTMSNSGSAYIFEKNTNGIWVEVQKIVASDRASGKLFGVTLSNSGDYILVGTNGTGAYLFQRNIDGSWVEIQKFLASDGTSNDCFGCSVSISGEHALVGAPAEDEDENGLNTILNAGAVYIYEKNVVNNWTEVQKLIANDRHYLDNFGYSVAVNGNQIIVGSRNNDIDDLGNDSLSNAGAGYIFRQLSTGTWSQVQKIVASDRAIDDNFSYSCAICNNSIIVGSISEDEDENGLNTLNNSGSSYIFELTLNDTINYSSCSNYFFNGVDYNLSGTYIQTYTNSIGCDSLVALVLTIQNQVANYNSIYNGNGNYSFTNTSIGSFNKNYWAFGDGTTSTIANPNHTFTANGSYVVVLTVNDSTLGSSCRDYYTDTIVVTGVVNPAQCVAGFVMYPDAGNVTVINSSTGTNLTYLWDFGDGNTSSQAFPTHTYATSDNYYLCLTIDDGAGCVDMYCDSIGENGVVFNKQTGFTINVIAPPIVTGLENTSVLNSLTRIYPNPTSTQLTIDTKLAIKEVILIDLTGKIIRTVVPKANKINVSDLSNGIYFIKVVGEEQTIIQKFVKD